MTAVKQSINLFNIQHKPLEEIQRHLIAIYNNHISFHPHAHTHYLKPQTEMPRRPPHAPQHQVEDICTENTTDTSICVLLDFKHNQLVLRRWSNQIERCDVIKQTWRFMGNVSSVIRTMRSGLCPSEVLSSAQATKHLNPFPLINALDFWRNQSNLLKPTQVASLRSAQWDVVLHITLFSWKAQGFEPEPTRSLLS